MASHARKPKPRTKSKAPTLKGTRLVMVRRVSRVNGRAGETFLSPQEQEDRCRGYAARLGAEIVESVDELDSVSGGSTEREGLEYALALCDEGRADGIVVAKVDRFARTVVGGLTVIARMEERGHWLLSEREGVMVGDERATATDKLVRNFFLMLAQWQRDTLAESWEAVRARKIGAGVHLAIPYGYRRGEGGRLAPDPAEAPFVEMVFKLRAAGEGWLGIAHKLNEAGARPRRAKLFTHRTIHEMVKVRTYFGEARSGEYVTEDAHEPIVSRELWDAANGVIPRRTRSQREDGVNVLAGILRCSSCGQRMSAQWVNGKQRAKASGRASRYYRCKGSYSWGKCPAPASVNASDAEGFVVDLFLKTFRDLEAIAAQDSDAIARAQAATDEAQADLSAYLTSPTITKLQRTDPATWEEGAAARERALQDAREELDAAYVAANVVKLPADLGSDWETIGDHEKRAYLTDFFDLVAVRPSAFYREPAADRCVPFTRGQADAPKLVSSERCAITLAA